MSRIVANCREFPAKSGPFSTEQLAFFEQVRRRDAAGRAIAVPDFIDQSSTVAWRNTYSKPVPDKSNSETFSICVLSVSLTPTVSPF